MGYAFSGKGVLSLQTVYPWEISQSNKLEGARASLAKIQTKMDAFRKKGQPVPKSLEASFESAQASVQDYRSGLDAIRDTIKSVEEGQKEIASNWRLFD